MRICLLLSYQAFLVHGVNVERKHLTSTAAVYGYYLGREFQRRGIEVVYGDAGQPNFAMDLAAMGDEEILRYHESLKIPPADHVICLEQALAYYRDVRFVDFLRTKAPGRVTTICDHDRHLKNEDIVFTARLPASCSDRIAYVGWAADPEIFFPQKCREKITIFIDHLASPDESIDDTDAIISSCLEFVGQPSRFRSRYGMDAEVLFFGPKGIEVLDLSRPEAFGPWSREERTKLLSSYLRVGQDELASAFKRSDIYVATHTESMGLPVLEAAMSGCIIVARANYIAAELIRPLHHILWQLRIPWEEAVARRDARLASQLAKEFSWSALAERMLTVLTSPATPRAVLYNTGTSGRRKLLVSGNAVICSRPAPVADITIQQDSWFQAGCSLVDHEAYPRSPQHGAGVCGILAGEANSYHYIYKFVNKLPRPTEMSFGVFLRPALCTRVGIWAFSGTQSFRVQADFVLTDLGDVQSISSTEGWDVLDAQLLLVDGWYWCGMSFRSDWGPRLGIGLFCLRDDGSYVFPPGGERGPEVDLYASGALLQFGKWPVVII